MSATFHKPPPRHYRLGGFRINMDTAELHPVMDRPTVTEAIFNKVKAFVAGVHWMLVTQSAPFKGYKNMNPSEIPQFEVGEKEAIAQKLLEEAGIEEYEFATVLD
ncbi:hypothetical protein BGW80DRAFT_1347792 [Lactifluus volemus]|nr:hypothetical protein BGW80DRAFT_1347792 [Lactifluus volemus]